MAIVFISAKQKQQSFMWGIFILLALLLVAGLLAISLPGFLNPKQVGPAALLGGGQVKNPPANLAINFSVVDSEKVKALEPFSIKENIFAYTITDKNGRKITGNISAKTKEEAQNLLEGSGYKVVTIVEMIVGRSEPFISY